MLNSNDGNFGSGFVKTDEYWEVSDNDVSKAFSSNQYKNLQMRVHDGST